MKLLQLEAYTYYNEYSKIKGRQARGAYIEETAAALGVVPSTIYRAFRDIEGGKKRTNRCDKGKPRFKDMSDDEVKLAAQRVAAMKIQMATKEEKTASTGSVIFALYQSGELRHLIPESTMNRWLNWFGYSYRQIRNYQTSTGTRLFTDRPNKWFFVDSSVSELYYLNSRGAVIRDTSGIITDKNHREEILTRKGLRKLLIFGAVDLFSRSYWFNAYVTPGESAAAWITFLMDLFQSKPDPNNPFRGIPENIYSDRGSGLHNQRVKDLFASLGITIWDHMPGNAKAKGIIESRIGAYKNNIERVMAFEKVDSLERYREITQAMITADNIKKGHFARWMEIYKTPEYLREFDESLRRKVGYSMTERKVDAYGCVSIEGKQFFVSRRLHGEWVSVYTLFNDTMRAIDRMGNIHELSSPDRQNTPMGTYRAEKKTDYDRDLEQIQSEGMRLRGVVRPEHFIDAAPENVRVFNRRGVDIDVSSPLDESPITSVEDAWYRVYQSTHFSRKNIPVDTADKIDWLFHRIIEVEGGISREKFSEILEIVSDTVREAQAL